MERTINAEVATGCLDWLPVCKAECCRQIRFRIPGIHQVPINQVLAQKELSFLEDDKDMIWYYGLHGANYEHGRIIIPFGPEGVKLTKDRLTIMQKCSLLKDDCTCKGHPEEYPAFCKALDENSEERHFTNNCLFKRTKQ